MLKLYTLPGRNLDILDLIYIFHCIKDILIRGYEDNVNSVYMYLRVND